MNKQADIRTERGITLNDGRLTHRVKWKLKYIKKKMGELIKTKQRNNEVKKKKLQIEINLKIKNLFIEKVF